MMSFGRIAKQVVSLGMVLSCGCAAGAMRIDVDVYKGPLAHSSDTQFASLIGYLEETKRSLVHKINATLLIAANEGFENLGSKTVTLITTNPGYVDSRRMQSEDNTKADCPHVYFKAVSVQAFLAGKQNNNESTKEACSKSESEPENGTAGLYLYFPYNDESAWKAPTINEPIGWCDRLDAVGWYDLLSHSDCLMLRAVFSDSRDMLRDVDRLLGEHNKEVRVQHWDINEWRTRKLLLDVAELASKIRKKVSDYAEGSVAGVTPNCKVRIAMMNFVLFASESGNQLRTRADALLKQLSLRDGRDARELALSTYLQDTEPTDFVHLFDWLSASADGCTGDWFRRYLWPGFPSISVQDRVKVLERLYGDYYWSRINTVHASGAGKVNKVFVKDGIGNWNLKNFENHPGELLEAYLSLGKKMLETAAKVAAASSGVAAGGVAIEAALRFASQAIADPPPTMGGTQLLEDLTAQEQGLRSRIMNEIQKAKVEEESITGDLEEKGNLEKSKQVRKNLIERMENILTSFNDDMEVLKKSGQSEVGTKGSKEDLKAVQGMLNNQFVRP